jgi:hypothetical protein
MLETGAFRRFGVGAVHVYSARIPAWSAHFRNVNGTALSRRGSIAPASLPA